MKPINETELHKLRVALKVARDLLNAIEDNLEEVQEKLRGMDHTLTENATYNPRD